MNVIPRPPALPPEAPSGFNQIVLIFDRNPVAGEFMVLGSRAVRFVESLDQVSSSEKALVGLTAAETAASLVSYLQGSTLPNGGPDPVIYTALSDPDLISVGWPIGYPFGYTYGRWRYPLSRLYFPKLIHDFEWSFDPHDGPFNWWINVP